MMTLIVWGLGMLKMEDIVGLEVISADARVVGIVEGIGIDVEEWKIPALRIAVKKGVDETIGVKKPLFSSAKLHLRTSGVESISDTITLNADLKDAKSLAVVEGMVLMTAADVVGKRVICRKARQIGVADNIIFTPDKDWSIPYIEVKLDKTSVDDLNVKKPLLSSPIIRIQTSDVKTIGDMIMLKIDIEELSDFLEKKPTARKW
jgi:sporulation protein YlmC with PRC-barrel domain